MFDIGWLELIVIGIVALIVVGPKDLPGMFRTAGQFMGRMRGMAREFQRSMEQAADEAGVKEAVEGLNKIQGVTNPVGSAKNYARNFAKDTAGLGDVEAAAGDLTDTAAAVEKSTTPPKKAEPAPKADKAAES
ncbi:Sec-independent protein translocase protein TatB [Oceanibium sediminis]|uniref:Sec-independent protein translocase protein TatB n=1 Tax=Oceanibium sediminis TaxID=2026339 RepID=UPI000DD4C7F6|nr:Sec-independent protein translocase protein TatB [Oceanibium sediminis]